MEKKAVSEAASWPEEKKGATHIIAKLPVNGKTLKKIGTKTAKAMKIPILLYSIDAKKGSLSVFASSNNEALNASVWANALVGPLGGKAGGSATQASGAAKNTDNLDAAVAAVTELIQQL